MKKQHNRSAYKMELGSAYLEKIQSQLPQESVVVIITLHGLNDVGDGLNLSGFSGPYVEMKLSPGDDIGGEQHQRSSYKPGAVNPRWVSPIICTVGYCG